MSTVDIAEGRRLLAAATPGPWTAFIDNYGDDTWPGSMFITADPAEGQAPLCDDLYQSDALLIVWLRNNAEALLAGTPDLDVERLGRAMQEYEMPIPGTPRQRAEAIAKTYARLREAPDGR